MLYFSIKPDFFTVATETAPPSGVVFTRTVADLMEQELNGPGGWLPNDLPPFPSWCLDNRPNFQLGLLEVVRYSTRVLRDNLSRQRTTDKIDTDCENAFTRFSNDPLRWIMPSAEGKYKKAPDISVSKHLVKTGPSVSYFVHTPGSDAVSGTHTATFQAFKNTTIDEKITITVSCAVASPYFSELQDATAPQVIRIRNERFMIRTPL